MYFDRGIFERIRVDLPMRYHGRCNHPCPVCTILGNVDGFCCGSLADYVRVSLSRYALDFTAINKGTNHYFLSVSVR